MPVWWYIIYNCAYDYVHTTPEWFENGTEKSRLHHAGAKMFEKVTFAVTIWVRFLNGARWKWSAWRLRVNTNWTPLLFCTACISGLKTVNSNAFWLSSSFALFEIFWVHMSATVIAIEVLIKYCNNSLPNIYCSTSCLLACLFPIGQSVTETQSHWLIQTHRKLINFSTNELINSK